MEAFIHNLNTMHSRAGAQDAVLLHQLRHGYLAEGRMVMRNLLLATEAGLGNGETPHFPHPDFPRQGGRQLQPRRARTTTCSGWPSARSAKAPLPELCFVWTRPSTSSIISPATPKRKSPTWAAAPRDRQRIRPDPRDLQRRGNLSLHLHQPAAHRHQGQGRHRVVL